MKHVSARMMVVLIAMLIASVAAISRKGHTLTPGEVAQANDAAWRDGAYQGKLAKERGEMPHVAVGRWARTPDRTAFASGYEQAYGENLAQLTNASHGQR